MKYYTIYETLFPACFFAIAIWLCWIGLRGVLEKRPILFSARISFLFSVIFVVPFAVLCSTIIVYGPRGTNFDINEVGLALMPIVLWLSWRYSAGLTVVGADQAALDRALADTAKSLQLAYEPQSLALKPSSQASARVRGKQWLGCRFVRLASTIDAATQVAVRRELSDRLANDSSTLERGAYVVQLVSAAGLFIAGAVLHYVG